MINEASSSVSPYLNLYLSISGFAKSRNLARLREIAKINTHKIVGIPKSQNFVPANNSNNKIVKMVFSIRDQVDLLFVILPEERFHAKLIVVSHWLVVLSTAPNVITASGGPTRFVKTPVQCHMSELDSLPRQAQSFQLDTHKDKRSRI